MVQLTTKDKSDDIIINMIENEFNTKDLVLFNSPFPMLIVLVLYFIVVFYLGPKFMETRKPYELKTTMRVYNMGQVVYNCCIVYGAITNSDALPFLLKNICSSRCDEVTTCTYLSTVFLVYSWHFLVLKMIDLLDTVFMVLRKKNSNITFLHVYHHVAMVFFTWVSLVYAKPYQIALPGIFNTMVHAIMYSYYFLATFPHLKKYLWWKKHLTKIQLVQFVMIMIYLILLHHYDCNLPRTFTVFWVFNIFLIMLLFVNFYIRAYIVKSDINKGQRSHLKNS